MENVVFCEHCGNTLLPDYQFCPYCGKNLEKGESLEQVINDSFSRMEQVQAEDFLRRLEKLSSILSDLETEINAVLRSKK
ncbi:MAG: zinc ribbon domain-containing protein [Spirochaetales bacterium]|nr:zinc ribbon domain-containing protein [Spirochaetales bacterium]